MKISSEIASAAKLEGEERAVEYMAKGGYRMYRRGRRRDIALCQGMWCKDCHGEYVRMG